MSAMLHSSLTRYSAVTEASVMGVLFFAIFGAIAYFVLRPAAREGMERAGRLPLEETEVLNDSEKFR